ncbi:MAG: HEAT repeat domain-containing protein [Candidatus Sumerlaeota bacterium]|nr:HEAT repeat domain-containing protein [Candidatus Sumerlaeota bacterium]
MPNFSLKKEQIARLIPFVRHQMQTHPDMSARAMAMRCLGRWGDAESIPALTQALDASEKPLRLVAAGALILLRHKPLLEKSIERIVDEDEDIKPQHVIWVARRLGMEYSELQRLELPAAPAAAVPRTTDTLAGNPNNPASDESTSRTIREMRDRRKAALRRLSGEAAP